MTEVTPSSDPERCSCKNPWEAHRETGFVWLDGGREGVHRVWTRTEADAMSGVPLPFVKVYEPVSAVLRWAIAVQQGETVTLAQDPEKVYKEFVEAFSSVDVCPRCHGFGGIGFCGHSYHDRYV